MYPEKRLFLLILSVAAAGSADEGRPADPDPNRFAAEIKAFSEWDRKNAVPTEPVLFVGSSSIRMWHTRECFPHLPVVNRGFGGSHISDVIHFTGRIVLPYNPSTIVFYAGDNDIAGDKSARQVLRDYRKWVGLVHARLPEARIVFISIKPSGQRWALWPQMQAANDMIRDLCRQDSRLFFGDLATPLLGPDGKPNPGFFLSDRLHLNDKGYTVWTKALRPILDDALTRSAPGSTPP